MFYPLSHQLNRYGHPGGEAVLAVRGGLAGPGGGPSEPAGDAGDAPAAATAVSVAGTAVADAFRQEWGRITAALIHQIGDWDLAEDCAQDAFAQALQRWPRDGVPERPGAWLMTVARNRAIDRLRRSSTHRAKIGELAVMATRESGTGDPDPGVDDSGVPDERLRLIFTCCHPALAMEARVALTLRTLAGLSTAEIAHAFLVPEATMAKRLVRAKHKIANAHPVPGTVGQSLARTGTRGTRGPLPGVQRGLPGQRRG
jgi:RNA polymerase sigma factor (sigma-70 family)